jgi:hypothetical protein
MCGWEAAAGRTAERQRVLIPGARGRAIGWQAAGVRFAPAKKSPHECGDGSLKAAPHLEQHIEIGGETTAAMAEEVAEGRVGDV